MLVRRDDSGQRWEPLPGLSDHETRSKGNPGAGHTGLSTIPIDRENPNRMYVGISAAGTFRSDDGGESSRPVHTGVVVDFPPEKRPEVGPGVHPVALDMANPRTLYRQDHNGIYVSRDAAGNWIRIGRPLPYDFGFATASPKARPGTASFVPLEGRSWLTMYGGVQVYRWPEWGRSWQPTVRGHPFAGEVGTHREGLAADDRGPPGLCLGPTTGRPFVIPDGART
jgi:hypothetical protein